MSLFQWKIRFDITKRSYRELCGNKNGDIINWIKNGSPVAFLAIRPYVLPNKKRIEFGYHHGEKWITSHCDPFVIEKGSYEIRCGQLIASAIIGLNMTLNGHDFRKWEISYNDPEGYDNIYHGDVIKGTKTILSNVKLILGASSI
jgi:hypothetical protein